MTRIQGLLAMAAQGKAADDRMATFALNDFRRGQLTKLETVNALRAAGRFEAEIVELMA